MNTLENNKIIAEFMGMHEDKGGFLRYGKEWYEKTKAEALVYDSDYNDLMSVWFKFRDLKFELKQVKQRGNFAVFCQAIAFAICYESIEKAHELLSNGIKWYNENK